MGNERAGAYAAGIGASIIFGFSFLFTKNALDYLPPFHLIAFRFLLAALLLTLLKVSGLVKIDYSGKDIRPLLYTAFFQPFIYFICETYGIKLISSSQAGMMIALIPVIVAVLSATILGERTTVLQTISILLSVGGVFVIILMQRNGELAEGSLPGYLLLLGAVAAAALFNIMSRKSSQQFKPIEITFVMMWVGAVVFNIIAVVQHLQVGQLRQYFSPLLQREVVLSVVYLGILSSIGAFFLINFALSRLLASQAAVFANLTTVVSIFAGVVFRGEAFFWYHALGAAMILLGVWGTNYFSRTPRAQKGQVGDQA